MMSTTTDHAPSKVFTYRGGGDEVPNDVTEVVIDPSVKEIGNWAFRYCRSLTSVHIPEGVERIGEGAFMHCPSLTSAHIPEGVKSIGDNAFHGCASLTSVHISVGVKTIGGGAFMHCSSLRSVNIPEGVGTIGGGAFQYCSSLISVYIPEGVGTIGNAFTGCSSLASVYIPKGVKTIEDTAFKNCTILDKACKDHGCNNVNDFLRHCFDDMTTLHRICYRANISPDAIRNHPGHVARADVLGITPLHLLASNPSVTEDALNILLEHSDAVSACIQRATNGMCPLHFLVLNPSLTTSIFKALLKKNPDAAAVKDAKGRCPLHLLCTVRATKDMVETLINAYPQASQITDSQHDFPLTLALRNRLDQEVQVWLMSTNPIGASSVERYNFDALKAIAETFLERLKSNPPRSSSEFLPAQQHGWAKLISTNDVPDISNGLMNEIFKLIQDESKYDRCIIETLAYAKDLFGRPAIEIAVPKIKAALQERILFLGRYDVDFKGPPIHKSATCEVRFATDESDNERRQVALKIMNSRKHFDSELKARLVLYPTIRPGSGKDVEPDRNRFCRNFVLELYRYHDKAEGCILVMPRADRSLDDIIRAEHIAGKEVHLIRHIAIKIAIALQHLHSNKKYIHADVKPRNIVRIGEYYKLIDLDSAVKMKKIVGKEQVSTGYCPPELVKPRILEREYSEVQGIEQEMKQIKNGKVSYPVASPTFDIWSFGVVMYRMLTGISLFKCNDEDDLVGPEEELMVARWEGLDNNSLKYVLKDCHGVSTEDVSAAKDMLKKCLQPNPNDRPQSMADVLSMPFLNRPADFDWSPGERNKIHVMFSDPLVWKDNDGTLHPCVRLDFAREKDLLVQCLRDSKRNIHLSFDPATAIRLQDLAATRCGCLHFSGHGYPPYLLFEDGCGGSHLLTSDDLCLLIPSFAPFKFVFVSACHSENIGKFFIESRVPHVLCCECSAELEDVVAAEFTRSFYRVVAEGRNIDEAYEWAKGAVTVKYGEGVAENFLLLPKDANHAVMLFDADHLDWNSNDMMVAKREIPLPPVSFIGQEVAIYDVVSSLLDGREKCRLVNVIGDSVDKRSNVALAALHYLSDRLHTTLGIEHAFYVKVNTEESGLDTLMTAVLERLVGSSDSNMGKGLNLADSVCSTLNDLMAVLVLDTASGQEDCVPILLRTIFEKTCHTKVVLVSQEQVTLSATKSGKVVQVS